MANARSSDLLRQVRTLFGAGRSRGCPTRSCWSGSRPEVPGGRGCASPPRRPSRPWWPAMGRWSWASAGAPWPTPATSRMPSRLPSSCWCAGLARSGWVTRWVDGSTAWPAGSRPRPGLAPSELGSGPPRSRSSRRPGSCGRSGRVAGGPRRGSEPAAREVPGSGRPLPSRGPEPRRGGGPAALAGRHGQRAALASPRSAERPAGPPRPGPDRRFDGHAAGRRGSQGGRSRTARRGDRPGRDPALDGRSVAGRGRLGVGPFFDERGLAGGGRVQAEGRRRGSAGHRRCRGRGRGGRRGAAGGRNPSGDRGSGRGPAVATNPAADRSAGHRPADEIVKEIEAMLKTARRPLLTRSSIRTHSTDRRARRRIEDGVSRRPTRRALLARAVGFAQLHPKEGRGPRRDRRGSQDDEQTPC